MTSLHSDLVELNLHRAFHYEQDADPGAVGAGKYWLKTDEDPMLIFRRNATDDDWNSVGGGGGGPSAFDGVKASRSANQSIPDATPTAVSWQTNFWDLTSDWIIGGTPTRLTNQFGADGYCNVHGQVRWGASAAGSRTIAIRKNGTDIYAEKVLVDAQGDDDQEISTRMILVTGDYVELIVTQDSGGALDIVQSDFFSPMLEVTKEGLV